MKKLLFVIYISFCILFASCGNATDTGVPGGTEGQVEKRDSEKGEKTMYQQITAEDAKKIMDSDEDFVILDVREKDEYDSGHIPGAILLPYTETDAKAEELLPNKDMQILVYCRSGRRSKIASENLVNLGYTNVKEFGGIIDWKYDIET